MQIDLVPRQFGCWPGNVALNRPRIPGSARTVGSVMASQAPSPQDPSSHPHRAHRPSIQVLNLHIYTKIPFSTPNLISYLTMSGMIVPDPESGLEFKQVASFPGPVQLSIACSIVPGPNPAFRHLVRYCKVTESWAGPGNEAVCQISCEFFESLRILLTEFRSFYL